jgi:hypothetical protein
MASERDRAKSAITEQSDNDPGLQVVLDQGHELKHKYDVAVEQNRSKEQLRAMDLGRFGRLVGGETSASIFSAFVVVCVGLVAFVLCLIAAMHSQSDRDFWSKQSERSISLSLTALSFIFGKSSSKNSSK